jgi:hypothetical protein
MPDQSTNSGILSQQERAYHAQVGTLFLVKAHRGPVATITSSVPGAGYTVESHPDEGEFNHIAELDIACSQRPRKRLHRGS